MRIETYGQQIEVTPALREYVETKLQRLQRHFDQHCEVRTQLACASPTTTSKPPSTSPDERCTPMRAPRPCTQPSTCSPTRLDRLVISTSEKKHDHHAREVRDNLA